jgi:hypothetical protein
LNGKLKFGQSLDKGDRIQHIQHNVDVIDIDGTIAQLIKPLIITPGVPGFDPGLHLGFFRDTFSVSQLPRVVLVRSPGSPRMYQC